MEAPNWPGVYVLENAVTGECYIGSSVNLADRWQRHTQRLAENRHENERLQRAWAKYGPDAFSFSTIAYEADLEKRIDLEQFWMDDYRKRGIGLYNLSPTAGSPRGWKHSPEIRSRIGEAARAAWANGAHSRRFTGLRHKPETIVLMRRAAAQRKGGRNSQYGSFWACNDQTGENKKIRVADVLPDGWRRGRIIGVTPVGVGTDPENQRV